MKPHAAFMLRTSIRQGVRRIQPTLVLALVAFLFSARPVLADDKNKLGNIFGPIEVHLVFTDPTGKEQDYSLAEAPPDFLKKLPPRLQLESKLPLLKPQVLAFDWLWLANAANVCKEVVKDVEAYRGSVSGDTPYDVSCRPFKFAYMNAEILPNAPAYFTKYNSMGVEVIPAGGYPTGKVRQLQIQMRTPPLNIVPFTLTTSCTCHDKNAACNKDPDFTMLFEVWFVVRVNSTQLNSMQFGPRPQMQVGYDVMTTALVMKSGMGFEKQVADLEATLEHQLEVDVASLAATGELSFVTVIAQFFYDLFKYGIGGLLEASCDSNLYSPMGSGLSVGVGAGVSGISPTFTVAKMANTASKAFKTLFLALDSASEVGFTKLDVEMGPKKSLVFKLTYTPDKPELQNTVAAENKGIHLSPPSIGSGVQQIKPGLPFQVRGNNFRLPYANALDLNWSKTVAGIANSTVQWGPKGGQMQNSPPVIGVTGFHAPNLKPSTSYQFRVHECDVIACAPWSEWLEASTQSGGSNDVDVWLDSDAAHPIGSGVVGPNGSFIVKATMPAGTAPGSHTVNAGTKGGKPEASFQITVTGQGLPGGGPTGGPSISVMNTQTHTAYQSPTLFYPSTFRLRGNGFAPGVTVAVHLDSATGPQLGTAIPNKVGVFAGNFNLPMTQTGPHQLVAIQVVQGRTNQASEDVNLASQPK